MQRRTIFKAIANFALLTSAGAVFGQNSALDTRYTAWDALLRKHVRWLPDGVQSRVDYAGMAQDRAALQQVLAQWSAVTPAQYQALPRPEQMAFLVNAYNGFTVELILTAYPKLKSIKDLGSFIQSPWKKKFFKLLGEDRHLDWIEHEQLRPLFAEPRVHAAVNCASIGCPALRPEAFTAPKLEAQLEDGMKRFMADATRNRVANGQLEVSQIFKWFKEDFEKGHLGLNKVEDLFARYANELARNPAEQAQLTAQLKARSLRVTYLDYDWALNDVGR